ncbi:MAG: DUF433 domain-containing protein [Chloroflexi bacterium]|nr:DUF433 domain-containing protein [Chloroflexota bacterium]MBU1662232.1 DUF433 domain-containing protein [Chloroflexota bacterium]
MKNKNLQDRIALDPNIMVGKPIIRGTRIPVAIVLKMLGQGIPIEEILHEYPRLEAADIEAAIAYAASVVEHEDVFPIPMQRELALA